MKSMQQVEAGRTDQRLGLDPRSYGNEKSAINLVQEVNLFVLELC